MNHKSIPKWEGIRTDQYTYAKYFDQDPPYEFLHDRSADPDQLKNVANDEEYAEVLRALRDQTELELAAQMTVRRRPPHTSKR